MAAFLIANMAPIMFASLVVFLLLGLSGGVFAGRGRADLRLCRHRARRIPAGLPAGASRTRLRRDEQRHAAGDPVLHIHGTGARTIRHGGGSARHHRAVVRHHPRRPCLRGRVRRRVARGHHRRGRRLRHFDGPDLAADHAALRLRPPDGFRHHRSLRHAGADHPAVAGADRDGRPTRQVGRRHVRGRLHSGPGARRSLCRLRLPCDADLSQGGAGPAGRGDRLSREGRQPRTCFAGRAVPSRAACSGGS